MEVLASVFLLVVFLQSCSTQYPGADIPVYLSLISGHYSNEQDLIRLEDNEIKTKQSLVNVYLRVLQIPALDWNYVVYIEKYVDDVLDLQQILHYTEVNDVILAEQYNFTHPEDFVPGKFDISQLETLKEEDLTTRKGCVSICRRIEEAVYIMQWPDCSAYGEISSRYSITFTCSGSSYIVTPNNFIEGPSKLPYKFNKVKSYPVSPEIIPNYEALLKKLCG
ncbi:uncharacterized protein LOC129928336 [Biomphalaria glabrata]|uniref:Uncharacterized protein LOC129928336 n=1 Tax=Biomphalaria glabrata TaxID=6526 RepID=A0A9W3BFT8_BIOGL|nr:uncharacterized protein LOC129928336 [Biomphalaria glabrata]